MQNKCIPTSSLSIGTFNSKGVPGGDEGKEMILPFETLEILKLWASISKEIEKDELEWEKERGGGRWNDFSS